MSDPVFPVKNGQQGAGIAEISKIAPLGMITLRGDFSTRGLRKAVKQASDCEIPGVREVALSGDKGVAWMSPDEVLIMCAHSDVAATLSDLQRAVSKEHALAVNVSDARAVFEVSGPSARDVMAKLAPVDVAPGQFGPGQIRRTRLAQVAAAFWMTDTQTFRIVCFRSVAQYVHDLLHVAAQPGSEVGIFDKA